MTLGLTFLDVILLIVWAGLVALCAKRGVAGFVVGLGGLLLWPLFNSLAASFKPWGLILVVPAGLLLGQLSRVVLTTSLAATIPDQVRQIMGGVGGGLLGFFLVLSFSLAFPIKPNPAQNNFSYPSPALDRGVVAMVRDSAFQKFASNNLRVWRGGLLKSYLLPDRIK